MPDVQEPLEKKTSPEHSGAGVLGALPPASADEPAEILHVARRHDRHRPSVLWPLVLITAGVLLLLSNLGYLSWQSWNLLWRLWPLLLVALGIDLIIGRRSLVGAVVSGLLILLLIGGAVGVVLFAQNIPGLVQITGPVEWRTEHIEYPLQDMQQASVSIDYASLPGHLSALSDSPNLIEGDITYRGQLSFDVDVRGNQAQVKLDSHYSGIGFAPDFMERKEGRWDIQLSPRVPLDLALHASSGSYEFDLVGLRINDLFLDAGSGSIDLALPSGSTFEARVDGGSGHLSISLPESVGMRVELDSGSGDFRPDDRFQLVEGRHGDDGAWETEGFETAEHRVILKLDQGSGSVEIHRDRFN